ncbi:unnamed protein product [Amoebophrya sp. A120]|nr:unnamed protein product [Amoebophrya sp. A120]|eukprot:GSA120T00003634001.1
MKGTTAAVPPRAPFAGFRFYLKLCLVYSTLFVLLPFYFLVPPLEQSFYLLLLFNLIPLITTHVWFWIHILGTVPLLILLFPMFALLHPEWDAAILFEGAAPAQLPVIYFHPDLAERLDHKLAWRKALEAERVPMPDLVGVLQIEIRRTTGVDFRSSETTEDNDASSAAGILNEDEREDDEMDDSSDHHSYLGLYGSHDHHDVFDHASGKYLTCVRFQDAHAWRKNSRSGSEGVDREKQKGQTEATEKKEIAGAAGAPHHPADEGLKMIDLEKQLVIKPDVGTFGIGVQVESLRNFLHARLLQKGVSFEENIEKSGVAGTLEKLACPPQVDGVLAAAGTTAETSLVVTSRETYIIEELLHDAEDSSLARTYRLTTMMDHRRGEGKQAVTGDTKSVQDVDEQEGNFYEMKNTEMLENSDASRTPATSLPRATAVGLLQVADKASKQVSNRGEIEVLDPSTAFDGSKKELSYETTRDQVVRLHSAYFPQAPSIGWDLLFDASRGGFVVLEGNLGAGICWRNAVACPKLLATADTFFRAFYRERVVPRLRKHVALYFGVSPVENDLRAFFSTMALILTVNAIVLTVPFTVVFACRRLMICACLPITTDLDESGLDADIESNINDRDEVPEEDGAASVNNQKGIVSIAYVQGRPSAQDSAAVCFCFPRIAGIFCRNCFLLTCGFLHRVFNCGPSVQTIKIPSMWSDFHFKKVASQEANDIELGAYVRE